MMGNIKSSGPHLPLSRQNVVPFTVSGYLLCRVEKAWRSQHRPRIPEKQIHQGRFCPSKQTWC